MPLNRTPPSNSELSQSNENLVPECSMTETPKFKQGFRNKRRRSDEVGDRLASFMVEIKEILESFKKEQNCKFDKLEKIFLTMDEIRKQNNEIQSSVEFLSQKYDSVVNQIEKLECEKQANRQNLQLLEQKLDNYERLSRSTCIEVRNIPTVKSETKDSLLNTIIATAKILNMTLQPNEVKDVFRLNSKDPAHKTVFVDFNSVLTKERVIRYYRKANKDKNRPTTEKLRLPGPSKPIFISESLSTKTKKLLFLAKDFANTYQYTYCWTSSGKVYLRKKEGAPVILIKAELDLENLKVQI
ncbi:girdin-like [Maniola hyperantus]|uniref:girdin-like n=1 Tax=Aphantopus hyperantus TaxID=2795564 RepID=UPI00374A0B05